MTPIAGAQVPPPPPPALQVPNPPLLVDLKLAAAAVANGVQLSSFCGTWANANGVLP